MGTLSDFLRPQLVDGIFSGDTELGYPFWYFNLFNTKQSIVKSKFVLSLRLIFLAFALHIINIGVVVFYIRQKLKPDDTIYIDPHSNLNGQELLF